MKIQQLIENVDSEGLRETGLSELQEVINVYKSRINKWSTSSVSNKAYAAKLANEGRHADAEQAHTSMTIADRNVKKNTKTLNFLQTIHNLMSERTSDGDKEARDFRDNSLPEDSYDAVGPSAYLPQTVLRWLREVPQ